MNVAIMQPYFFPYVGYYALLYLSDKFVFYDDVNYHKQGWMNRNRMFGAKGVEYFTVPVVGRSSNKKISETYAVDVSEWGPKLVKKWKDCYKGDIGYIDSVRLLEDAICSGQKSIGDIAKKSIIVVAEYLDIESEIIWTSSIYNNQNISGTDRVLDICHKESTSRYINLPGGRQIYRKEEFLAEGIDLSFVTPKEPSSIIQDTDIQLSILHLIATRGKEVAKEIIASFYLA